MSKSWKRLDDYIKECQKLGKMCSLLSEGVSEETLRDILDKYAVLTRKEVADLSEAYWEGVE